MFGDINYQKQKRKRIVDGMMKGADLESRRAPSESESNNAPKKSGREKKNGGHGNAYKKHFGNGGSAVKAKPSEKTKKRSGIGVGTIISILWIVVTLLLTLSGLFDDPDADYDEDEYENEQMICDYSFSDEQDKAFAEYEMPQLPGEQTIVNTGYIAAAVGDEGKVAIAYDDAYISDLADGKLDSIDVNDWRDVKSLANYEDYCIAGVKNDGSVLVTGEWAEEFGYIKAQKEKGIRQAAFGCGSLALLTDKGTIVSAPEYAAEQTKDWKNIVQIAGDGDTLVGLHSDGTVSMCGDSMDGVSVDDWRDIVQVETAGGCVVGLVADGTVVAEGDNDYGQCEVSDWENIRQLSATSGFVAGLTADGRVEVSGRDSDYYRDDLDNWPDVVAIEANYMGIIGLTADGKLVCVGGNFEECLDEMKGIRIPEWAKDKE